MWKKFVCVLFSFIFFSPLAFGGGSSYLIGQAGKLITESTNHKNERVTLRLGGGYAWGMEQGIKIGIESAANVFNKVYFDLFYFPFTPAYITRYSVDVLGTLEWYGTERFEVFVKAGPAYVVQDMTGFTPFLYETQYVRRFVPKGIIGIGYDITRQINVSLLWQEEWAPKNSRIFNQHGLQLGLRYLFN